jgi:branched-chain amino acid transport system ATP-binding protein
MQGGKVFPNLTVSENLEMGSVTFPSEDRDEKVSAVLEVFTNLKDMLYRRAGLLSGGERQALALAIVLVKQPQVLLLDEPSSGLSPKLVQGMLAKVREFNNIWDTSILLVEQNVREALNIAHRALAMVNGEVVLDTDEPNFWLGEGQLEKLFLGGKYRKDIVP